MDERFGGSVRYESVLLAEAEPKPPNVVPGVARVLEAWDLDWRLLIFNELSS